MATRTDKALAKIAADKLGVETLETRGMDDLDFSEVSAAGLKAALEAAFEAGVKHSQRWGAFEGKAR
jgi:hypothetical protein